MHRDVVVVSIQNELPWVVVVSFFIDFPQRMVVDGPVLVVQEGTGRRGRRRRRRREEIGVVHSIIVPPILGGHANVVPLPGHLGGRDQGSRVQAFNYKVQQVRMDSHVEATPTLTEIQWW